MTDRKPTAIVPSADAGRGALTKQPAGDLVARGLADLQKLKAVTPSPEECYKRGLQVFWDQPPNYAEAVRWFRTAAEQGYALGQAVLGIQYSDGRGVAQDDAEAVRWYRQAADQGHAFAQHDLGRMYADGAGVPQDHTMALMWFNILDSRFIYENAYGATEMARKRGAERHGLAGLMSPAQIAEAQRLAREWAAAHPMIPRRPDVRSPLGEDPVGRGRLLIDQLGLHPTTLSSRSEALCRMGSGIR